MLESRGQEYHPRKKVKYKVGWRVLNWSLEDIVLPEDFYFLLLLFLK